jgi:hypothetical protein
MKDDKKTSVIDAYKTEIKDRFLSSKKRLLKTFGTIIIPFLYAFICI